MNDYDVVISVFISEKEGRKEMFYLTMHSSHFIYGYHMGFYFRLVGRDLLVLYAPFQVVFCFVFLFFFIYAPIQEVTFISCRPNIFHFILLPVIVCTLLDN